MNQDLKARTYQFGLAVVLLLKDNPPPPWAWGMTKQLVRCATSVGANYRASKRGRSVKEFIAKLGTCEEEADECVYWLNLCVDSDYLTAAQAQPFIKEAGELTAIFVASIKTARSKI